MHIYSEYLTCIISHGYFRHKYSQNGVSKPHSNYETPGGWGESRGEQISYIPCLIFQPNLDYPVPVFSVVEPVQSWPVPATGSG